MGMGDDFGDVDAASGHAFSLPIKALANGFFAVDVLIVKTHDFIPVRKSARPLDFAPVGDGHGLTNLPLRLWRGNDAGFKLLGSRMKACREEMEFFVSEGKPISSFMDAAFANDHGLRAFG